MIKKQLERVAFISTLLLMMTVDSYSTKTLGIIAGVFVFALIAWNLGNRNEPTIADTPVIKQDEALNKWLNKTIKKIDKMGDM